MKKTLALGLVTALTLGFSAEANNELKVSEVATSGTTKTITLSLVNDDLISGFSFDLVMPAEFTYEFWDDEEETIINTSKFNGIKGSKWTVDIAKINATTYNFFVFSMDKDVPVFQNETDTPSKIFEIKVTANSSFVGGFVDIQNFQCSNGGEALPVSTEGKLEGTMSLTLGANGYSSYSACAPVQVAGATVKGATISGNKLILSGTGDVVPANTGVILKGTEGATVTLTAASSVSPISTDLTAAVVPTTVEANKTMVLSTKSSVTGFYVFTGTTITANKAYLASVPSSAPLRIVEDETTGIEEVESEANVGFNYNLMGQQIKSQKGFAIENGKKVVRF